MAMDENAPRSDLELREEGFAFESLDKGVEGVHTILCRSGEIGSDCCERLGSCKTFEASSYFGLDLDHPDVAFGLVMPTSGLCRVVSPRRGHLGEGI